MAMNLNLDMLQILFILLSIFHCYIQAGAKIFIF